MIQPVEMKRAFPMTLHGSVMSTTSEVWEMLSVTRAGDLDRVTQLISKRPALSTCQYNYTPPLHFAVREGHLALVRALVAHDAFDSNYKSYPFGDTFLTMADDREYDEIVACLRNANGRRWGETGKIDYKQDEQQKRFDKAVHDENLQEVEGLLKDRPDLAQNELSSWAEGVLMMPSRGNNRALVELLLSYAARVPAISKWGRFYYFKHDEIAAFLLDNGMSPAHATWHHVTLLHDMAQAGDISKAKLLLDHGADIDAVDEEYRSTPIGLAARWGRRDMVAFLLARGADPNKAGATWSTPLAWAQKKGHAEIERDLATAGATSVKPRGNSGTSP